jgi:hypothetical protein
LFPYVYRFGQPIFDRLFSGCEVFPVSVSERLGEKFASPAGPQQRGGRRLERSSPVPVKIESHEGRTIFGPYRWVKFRYGDARVLAAIPGGMLSRMTIVDREYTDYRQIATTYGVTLDTEWPTGAFTAESDWYFRASGRGVPCGAGRRPRWLVTYASPQRRHTLIGGDDPEGKADGWLIAYEIDRDDKKTGRCLVIAGPWNRYTDDRLCAIRPKGDVTVEDLIAWLRSQQV